MGHAYVKNLSEILMKRIYAKGKVSIRELVDYCVEHKIALHASERDYFDEYMLAYGFEELVLFHARKWCENKHRPNIEAIPETDKEKELVKEFMENGISNIDNEEDTKTFLNIKWKFTQGTRKMYIEKTMTLMYHLEN